MKCIQCDTDNNLKDRTANQGRCKNCNHPFAFEPTTMEPNVKVTDGFFAKALADISANDTLYFTPQQLSYLIQKRLGRKEILAARASGIFSGFGVMLFGFFLGLNVFWAWFILLPLGIYAFVAGVFMLPRRMRFTPRTVSQTTLNTWLEQWQRVNPSPAKLLPPPGSAPVLTPVDDDVTAYSFDRVLVCDSVAIAQLLIANNIHFEHNCAVLSITGYPRAIFATTMAMLRRNPDLQVIALHNCSPPGVALINELRTSPDWFLDSTPVIFDLGMLPRQIAAARGQAYIQISADFAQAARVMPPEVSQQLTATELEWLEAGYFVDLESFTPKKLMQIVSHGIARLQNLGEDVDDNLILVGDVGSGGGTFIYASDNFG
jgi:hypothetical protein